jgi:hypothetical protein
MPFGRAVKEVGYFLHTRVTEATVRRWTEAAGAAYVAVQEHEVAQLACNAHQETEAAIPECRRGLCAVNRRRMGGSQDVGDGRWWKPIAAASKRQGRSEPSPMAPNGVRVWRTFTDRRRSGFSTSPHTGEHLAQMSQAVFGEGTSATETWFTRHLHQLKQAGPLSVLAEAHQLMATRTDLTELPEPVVYWEKREPHLQCPTVSVQFRKKIGIIFHSLCRWS